MKKVFLTIAAITLMASGASAMTSVTSSVSPVVENIAASADEWDKILDEYEKFINQYIAYAKKAKNGDVTAIAKLPSLMQKAQSLSDKLSKASSEMTAAQMARYTKLVKKLADAAQSM